MGGVPAMTKDNGAAIRKFLLASTLAYLVAAVLSPDRGAMFSLPSRRIIFVNAFFISAPFLVPDSKELSTNN